MNVTVLHKGKQDTQFNHTLLNKLYICFSDQEERTKAIEAFKEENKDVLVATDVASKGLDFPAIQHVVNYDMPEEIENYGRFSDDCFWHYWFIVKAYWFVYTTVQMFEVSKIYVCIYFYSAEHKKVPL